MGQNYGEILNNEMVYVTETIVSSDRPVTLVGPAGANPPDIKAALGFGGVLVAADGGAESALALGLVPDAVIGDFDSFDARGRVPDSRLHHVSEQDSTDFEKALSRIKAPRVLALGFLGLRIDHSLAVLSALAAHPAGWCVLIGGHDVVVHAPRHLVLDLERRTRVSLFPLAPVSGRSEGLEWPIDGIAFSPGGRVGTSNRATGPVTLDLDGPGMLLILPRDRLGVLLAALELG